MHFLQAADTTPVRLTVNPPTMCQGWGTAFNQAGWRSFVQPLRHDAKVLSWIVKRGASCFMLQQLADEPHEMTLTLPTIEAGEICALMAKTGLAVPAAS